MWLNRYHNLTPRPHRLWPHQLLGDSDIQRSNRFLDFRDNDRADCQWIWEPELMASICCQLAFIVVFFLIVMLLLAVDMDKLLYSGIVWECLSFLSLVFYMSGTSRSFWVLMSSISDNNYYTSTLQIHMCTCREIK